ncbi:metabotropic glutamate receptor 4-like [Amphiura filiformis]|uniref:metabotropic glutamate receptor 4-like n=1 Tax=Amphiura filiformis TaxID=82378 RepID=UPI003B214203
MCRAKCGESVNDCATCLNVSAEFDRDKLFGKLLRTSFDSLANGRVSFNENGDTSGRYLIRNLQEFNDVYKFVDVGKWNDDVTSENVIGADTFVPWYVEVDNATGVPISDCGRPCEPGERRHVIPDNPCCWECIKCLPFEIVINNNTECSSCLDLDNDKYGEPNENFTACLDIELRRNPLAAAIITISVLMILFAIVITSLYEYHRKKVLLRDSSRGLSYVMLVGIFISYVTALLVGVFRISSGVCVMLRLGPPIATSLIYVSLAIKTIIRLYRKKLLLTSQLFSQYFQVAITIFITVIPTGWVIIWMVSDTQPRVTEVFPEGDMRYLQITCIRSNGETIGVMVWNIFIVLVFCTFAFLSRKLQLKLHKKFDKMKFITFYPFCSLVVLLAFTSTYFLVGDVYYRSGRFG